MDLQDYDEYKNKKFLLSQDFDALDDDLEVLEEVGFPRKIDRQDYFNTVADMEFFKQFRLKKETVAQVLSLIENVLESCEMNKAVAPMNQLLMTLRFYATDNHLSSIAEFGGVHVSTASRIVKKVSEAIARLSQKFIKFPLKTSIADVQRGFFEISSFPRVVGAIDATHIHIKSLGGEDVDDFHNKKSFYSLNIQGVADSKMKFRNIVVQWPGSVDDQTIFSKSNLCTEFENGMHHNGVLLGDSAYQLQPYLLTPLINPVNAVEHHYNAAHEETRCAVVKMFRLWKQRFPILSYGSHLKLETTMSVIVATAVLHNIARDNNEEEPPLDEGKKHILDVLIKDDNIPDTPPQNINILKHKMAQKVQLDFIRCFIRQ